MQLLSTWGGSSDESQDVHSLARPEGVRGESVDLRIQKEPTMRTFCERGVAKDKLCVPPITLRIDTETCSATSVQVNVGDDVVYLSPQMSKSCVGEFWACLLYTSDAADE